MNTEKSFTIYGHTFTAGRVIKQKERDKIFKTCTRIGINNYKEGKAGYDYNEFYKAANEAGIYKYDVFIMDGKGEVVPGSNELFAVNKEEAEKILPKKKTIYRTTITMTVLSEEPIGDVDMETVLTETQTGSWSGQNITIEQDHPLTGKEAAEAMLKQGSDPGFFQMDEKGNELED